ncbi:MAG: sulfatase [Haloarculaceae archaeon]
MDHVLFVTIDSLRTDHVGYHGYERDVTPTIDEYANRGSRFTRAFAHAGSTMYSFPSILSGVTPLMYGGHDRISDGQTLVSEVFDDAGYRTGAFHSNLYLSEQFGYNRGWDVFFDSAPDASAISRLRRWAKTNLKETPLFPVLKWGYDLLESKGGVNVGSYHVPADDITDMAIEFVEDDPAEPTFLWVHYMDVHHPFLPPEEYRNQFCEGEISDQEAIKLRRKFIEEPETVTDRERETFFDLYDAEIRFTDDEIGRLLDTVEQHWGDDYLLALTADHGDHFLEHGYFGGANGRDVKNHVPLFVTGWDDEGEYDEVVGLVDVPPTLVDAAGLDIPANFHGHNLRDLVFDGEWERDVVVGGWDTDVGRKVSVRSDEWRYIEYPHEPDVLYDVSEPYAERENVADTHPDVVRRLSNRIGDHLDVVATTQQADVERPDMDEDVKERLRRLGYQE